MTIKSKSIVLIMFSLFIFSPSILCAQQYIFPITSREKVEPKDKVDTTLETVLVKGWNSNFAIVRESFPGGLTREGSKTRKSAETYRLAVHLTELKLDADIIFHKPPHDPESLPVKLVNCRLTEKDKYEEKIELITKYLKDKFPHGGPFLRGNDQIGYVIPDHESCGDIVAEWGDHKQKNKETLRLTIQCHK